MPPKNITIIGAGIAGLTTALCLKHRQIPCTVYDEATNAKSKTTLTGVFELSPNAMRVLDMLGLQDSVMAVGAVTDQVRCFNSKGKQLCSLSQSSAEFGYPAVMVQRQAFMDVLLAEVERMDVKIEYGKRLEAIEKISKSEVRCFFEDGSVVVSSCVIGADGLWSTTRDYIYRCCKPSVRPTGVVMLSGSLSSSAFSSLPKGSMDVIFGDWGTIGYATTEAKADTLQSFNWWNAVPEPKTFRRSKRQHLSDEEKRQLVHDSHAHWFQDTVQAIVESAGSEKIVAERVFRLERLKRWSRGPVCLIGDAAHATGPLCGFGLSMALEDGVFMAAAIALHLPETGAEYPVAAFRWYERQRRERVDAVTELGRESGPKYRLGSVAEWIRDKLIESLMPNFGTKLFSWLYGYELPKSVMI